MKLSHPTSLKAFVKTAPRAVLKLAFGLLLIACGTACAQNADDYFNTGAQSYISNNIPAAKKIVEGGLKLYPDDVKLQKLEKLLEQQSQSKSQSQSQSQQSQQGQNQQGQNQQKDSKQQNQDKSQQNQDQKDQQQSEQQKQQDQQKQDQSQAKKQQQQDQKDQQDQSADQQKEKSDEEAKKEAAMMAAGQMTPQQAQQLLDSQKDDEQVLRFAPPNKNTLQSRNFKDW